MGGALAALKKGLSASMLQTSAGQTLRNIVEHSPAVSETERSTLMSFLESGEGGSDQIIGIVATMKEEMEADLKEATSTEKERILRRLRRQRRRRSRALPPSRHRRRRRSLRL